MRMWKSTCTEVRDDVLMYDGTRVCVTYEIDFDWNSQPGSYHYPPEHEIEDWDVNVVDIDAWEDENTEIEVDCNDLSDPYVQSAIQQFNEPDHENMWQNATEPEPEYEPEWSC